MTNCEPIQAVYHSQQPLMSVEGYYFEGTLLRAICLVFENRSLFFFAQDDDSLGVSTSKDAIPDDDLQVHDITASAHWSLAVGRTMTWVWRLTNQQGYLDGIQFEFSKDSYNKSWQVQILIVAGAVQAREIRRIL